MSYFTTFDLYSPDEAEKILHLVRSMDWRPGKARTERLTESLKHNTELKPTDNEMVGQLCKHHGRLLSEHRDVKTTHILKGVSPPKFNRYIAPGGDYRRHTDAPVMAGVRTDLACTTFFSDPETYTGGELCVEDNSGNVQRFKGKPGQCVIYPCGQPHWVEPVTEGERIGLVCWVQSYIRDAHKRQLLSGMIKSLTKIEDLSFENELIRDVWTELGSTHAALFKMWME